MGTVTREEEISGGVGQYATKRNRLQRVRGGEI